MIPPPQNFTYVSQSQSVCWDPVTGAEEYEIQCMEGPLGQWATIYTGSNSCCSFVRAAGEYSLRGKTKKDGRWGSFGMPEKVTVT